MRWLSNSFLRDFSAVLKMNDAQRISKFELKSFASGQLVPIESFWANGPCVIHFMRRFGCQYCRLVCQRISAIKPKLDENNVRLIGVGLEEFGVQDFVDGGYFTGELYVDEKKRCYDELGFKRYNWLTIWGALLTKTSREAYSSSTKEGVSGNLSGDGLQMGGTLVVGQGGTSVLFNFKQTESPGHNVENIDILRVLNIPADDSKITEEKPIACDDQSCQA